MSERRRAELGSAGGPQWAGEALGTEARKGARHGGMIGKDWSVVSWEWEGVQELRAKGERFTVRGAALFLVRSTNVGEAIDKIVATSVRFQDPDGP